MAEHLQLPSINRKIAAISQRYYGNHSLDAISGAGEIHRPALALVFINPTYRNIATNKGWDGLKAPWIGCTHIWQVLADAGLITPAANHRIQTTKTAWTTEFAREIYDHVAHQGLYITNIVKWAGLDASLPERDKVALYLPVLMEELHLVRPQHTIAFGQLTFEAIARAAGIRPPMAFGEWNESILRDNTLSGIVTPAGTVTPCYFPVGQGSKNKSKSVKILSLAATHQTARTKP